jgi:N-methylhydantoinase A
MLLGVDVGGTFTDAVLVDGAGVVWSAKAPTTPREQQVGVMQAVVGVLARAGARAHAHEVVRFAHGTTVATNALLEFSEARPPPRTALVATEGFTDIVELGRQARPSLYRLCEAPPRPLAPASLRFGAAERMGPAGPLRELEPRATEALLERLAQARPEAVAVVLLHSYAHPRHERRLGALIAERLPEAHVSLSHELVGTFREYERATTTEVDAALSPLLGAYLSELDEGTRASGLPPVRVMQSSGGLTDAAHARAHAALTVLSGPAGGVGGALLLSEAAGERDVLCFDMGGTSCDVCVIERGRVAETVERTVAGRPLALPALDIHTVGAGGGSIAWRDAGGALRVGPESAGADPGPACYGRGGGRATVTDANLVLGRLLADAPLAGGVSLDRGAAERAVGALARELGIEAIACAEGIMRVAETEMRGALGVMTVERGIDPRGFALMPFGGAGGLYAVAMAAELGIERVLCPRAGGVLSAMGLAAAPPRRDAASTVMLHGESLSRARVEREVKVLAGRAAAGLDGRVARLRGRFDLRYKGQSFELTVEGELGVDDFLGEGVVPAGDSVGGGEDGGGGSLLHPGRLREEFAGAHERRYGYREERGEVELVNVRISAFGEPPALRLAGGATGGRAAGGGAAEGRAAEGRTVAGRTARAARETVEVVFEGEPLQTRCWRGAPAEGARIEGPALCALPESTLLVPPGWGGTVDEHGTIVLERR